MNECMELGVHKLGIAMLTQAHRDLTYPQDRIDALMLPRDRINRNLDRANAEEWVHDAGEMFQLWCACACLDSLVVQERLLGLNR